ncbi:molybdopterin molybdotransferase MoeA [uncultured Cetobacterium sp.]|uniref:molybdopterin molybdotransferase MoeA n=1 Tax=uncultured Cetobacterium sp. TaxID=527638 RepID=UPI00263206E7|nr:molybdopterin molybdotransferase MoeA [uncultured Cetobacterium sp.]
MEHIDLEKAIELLIENTIALEQKEERNILESLGFVLGEDIYSPIDNPPFSRSPLDGFSFNNKISKNVSQNNPKEIDVFSEICAGDFLEKEVPFGSAVRIMTGAPIPKGCNCVLKQEEVEFNEENQTVTIYKEMKAFENFCYQGEDLEKGTLVIKKGELITYNHIGVFASIGINKVHVYKKPIIGILSLGNELTMPGERLESGKIFNSNLFTLASRLKSLGLESLIFNPLLDNINIVSDFIEANIHKVDLLITTGGVSVGKMDIMHDVIKKINAKRLFWKVNIQPGTPVLASVKNNKIILSLSGNPFASLVNFELLGRKILEKLSCNGIKSTYTLKAKVSGNFKKKSIKRRFIRAQYINGDVFVNNDKHSSGMISSLLNKNALIDINPGNNGLNDGDIVEVILID